MRVWLLLSLAAVTAAGCSSPTLNEATNNSASAASAQIAEPWLPEGARVEPSGFITVENAPPMPRQPDSPKAEIPGDERTIYARTAGVDNAEAQRRLEEQERARPEFERVNAALRREERGNFTDVRMIHRPDWAYVFYFKRNPQESLAKYSRNPHFKAAQARYSHEELQTLAKPWVDRFMAERILTGHGTDATFGEAQMSLVVSEPEYRAIAARKSWGPVPDAIKLEFSDGVDGDPVPAAMRPLIRVFPQNDRDLGITNQALLHGRIVLRDGCFYVVYPGQPDRLAYFPRELGLAVDSEGYLALRSRRPGGKLVGRVGEEFNWGGPIGMPVDAPMVSELRARCGTAPIEHVGIVSSAKKFRQTYSLDVQPSAPPKPPKPPRR